MDIETAKKLLERVTAYMLVIASAGGLIHMAMNSISVPTWYWAMFGSFAAWAGVPIAFGVAKSAIDKFRGS